MKASIKTRKEVEIKSVRISVAVRYGEEDIPKDFPLRTGDLWTAYVDIDTGQITGWPKGQTGNMHMKVVDEGCYSLLDASGDVVAKLEGDYVPHGVVPGEYGDYIILKIDANGIITNWPKHPDVDGFFDHGDE